MVYGVGFFAALWIVITAYICQQFEPGRSWDWNRIAFNGISIYFGVPTAYHATTYSNRMGFTFSLFSAIILTITVSSYSTTFATNPILKPQIESIAEVSDGTFGLVGDQFSFQKISHQNRVRPFD